jgi:hypothetical protein
MLSELGVDRERDAPCGRQLAMQLPVDPGRLGWCSLGSNSSGRDRRESQRGDRELRSSLKGGRARGVLDPLKLLGSA